MRILILDHGPEVGLAARACLAGTCRILRGLSPAPHVSANFRGGTGAEPDLLLEDWGAVQRDAAFCDLLLDRVPALNPGLAPGDRLRSLLHCAHMRRRLPATGYCLEPDRRPAQRLFPLRRVLFAGLYAVCYTTPDARDAAHAGLALPGSCLPDPAFALRPSDPEKIMDRIAATGAPREDTPLIGVAFSGAPDPGSWAGGVAAALDAFIEKHRAWAVFLPAGPGAEVVCEEIFSEMRSARGTVLSLEDPAEYKAAMNRMDLALTGEYTPAVLAAAVGTPVVTLDRGRGAALAGWLGAPHQSLDRDLFGRARLTVQLGDLLTQALRSPRASLARIEEIMAHSRKSLRSLIDTHPAMPRRLT